MLQRLQETQSNITMNRFVKHTLQATAEATEPQHDPCSPPALGEFAQSRDALWMGIVSVRALLHLPDSPLTVFMRESEKGKVGFLGGTIEPGESALDALRRELDEEGHIATEKLVLERLVAVHDTPGREVSCSLKKWEALWLALRAADLRHREASPHEERSTGRKPEVLPDGCKLHGGELLVPTAQFPDLVTVMSEKRWEKLQKPKGKRQENGEYLVKLRHVPQRAVWVPREIFERQCEAKDLNLPCRRERVLVPNYCTMFYAVATSEPPPKKIIEHKPVVQIDLTSAADFQRIKKPQRAIAELYMQQHLREQEK